MLEARELTKPFEVSQNTLEMMDEKSQSRKGWRANRFLFIRGTHIMYKIRMGIPQMQELWTNLENNKPAASRACVFF